MKVECAERRHGPYHFGKHAEGYHDEQIRAKRTQFADKFRIFQLHGLHQFQAVGFGILLDGGMEQFVSAAGRFVGHSHDANHIISSLDKAPQAFHCKVGCTEKNYFQ